MSFPERKLREIVDRLSPIEDIQERLAIVVDSARRKAPLAAEQRLDEHLVRGCSSRVWLIASVDYAGVCRFQMDADSTLVKGLAALVCEVYDGAPPAEITGEEAHVLEELRLMDQLTLTRRHGLEQVRRAIVEFALSAARAT